MYESAYTVWLSRALNNEKQYRLEHTCIFVYTLHTLVDTYAKSGFKSPCPKIAISSKIMKGIVAHLNYKEQHKIIKKVPYAGACLKSLTSKNMFSYSIEMGVKTMNLTRNLNPRSQYPEPLSVDRTISET